MKDYFWIAIYIIQVVIFMACMAIFMLGFGNDFTMALLIFSGLCALTANNEMNHEILLGEIRALSEKKDR